MLKRDIIHNPKTLKFNELCKLPKSLQLVRKRSNYQSYLSYLWGQVALDW